MNEEIKAILRAAIKSEIDGFKTYSQAAHKADKAEIRALFNRLANDEIKHRRILESELELMTNPKASFISLERETTPISDLEEQLVAAESAALTLREATKELAGYRDRLERELTMAKEVQNRLLPRTMPHLEGLDVSGRSLMARQVGGDYFDFSVRDGHLYMAIGDVMGKGLPAALLMATVRASWRAEVAGGFNPDEILSLINEATFEDFSSSHSFVSFISGEYLEDGSLSFANAGHPPPFYLRNEENQRVEEIITSDLLIGIDPTAEFSPVRLTLDQGDVLLFYTDGLIEAFKSEGETNVSKILAEHQTGSSEEIQNALVGEVLARTDGNPPDDVTLVVLKKAA